MKPSSHSLSRFSRLGFFLTLLFTLIATYNGRAALQASAQISNSSLGGGVFDYTITLHDTGTTNIGTFWFAWTPLQDYMGATPTSIISPTNWSDIITGSGNSDGRAIQWTTSSALLAPGGSLNFSFDSTVTPAQMAGNSPFFTSTPVETSFIYSGAPFSDSGFEFLVANAPEPSAVSLLLLGALGVAWVGSRRHLRRA